MGYTVQQNRTKQGRCTWFFRYTLKVANELRSEILAAERSFRNFTTLSLQIPWLYAKSWYQGIVLCQTTTRLSGAQLILSRNPILSHIRLLFFSRLGNESRSVRSLNTSTCMFRCRRRMHAICRYCVNESTIWTEMKNSLYSRECYFVVYLNKHQNITRVSMVQPSLNFSHVTVNLTLSNEFTYIEIEMLLFEKCTL